jgi:hypothetical protein
MKLWNYSILLLATGIFSCSKDQDLSAENNLIASSNTEIQSSPVASSWVQLGNWQPADSGEYRIYQQELPAAAVSTITSNGAVLVFAKNIVTPEGVYDKAVKLPYAVFPDFGRPKYHEYYYYQVNQNSITVKYRTNAGVYGVPVTPPSIQTNYRYILVPADLLQKLGQTPVTIARLSYTELTALLGLNG